jgi:predicted nucleotidyltransferase
MSVDGARMTPDAAALRGGAPGGAAPEGARPPPEAPDAAAWLPDAVDRIVREFRPLKVILFGSRARGDARAESDVDLLVVMPDAWAGARRRAAAVGIVRALRDLPVAKDVVVTTPEEIARRGGLVGTVLQRALAEGAVLYERP